MTVPGKRSGGAKSRVPDQVARQFNDKPDPLPVKESETPRQERAQGGFPNIRSSRDPGLGPVK
jgi:hypothetical protein